jgi:transmembrane sensor
MSTQKSPPSRAQDEAAEWLARLGNQRITTDTAHEFRDWLDNPANDAAYMEAEAVWEESGRQAADPEVMRMTEAAFARGRPAPRAWFRRPSVLWPATVACLALAGIGFVLAITVPPTYTTGPAEQRVVQLEDGSKIHLNVNSRVRVRFKPDERRLDLARGEAFFEVAHDAKRPFIVVADGTQVRALGTKFDVRDRGSAVLVTLVEGRISVRRDEQPSSWTLAPNQRLVVPDSGAARQATVDAAQSVSWTTGRLSFKDTPLGEAVAEVNRYDKVQIVLQGEDLKRRLLDGYFDVGNTYAFVTGISLEYDLQISGPVDGVITLRERSAAGA